MALPELVSACILLLIASIVAGWAPLFVLAPVKRRFVSTVGVGVLIGTAFVVTIPSGVHIMYMAPRQPTTHSFTQIPLPLPPSAHVNVGADANLLHSVIDS